MNALGKLEVMNALGKLEVMNALGKLEVMNALGKLEVMNALPNSYVNPLHISRRSTPNHGPQYLCYKLNYELLFISTFEFSYG